MNLPEKYEMLAKCFNSLDTAIRLLRLKRSMSTYTNICPKIERLIDRRFSYGNLAQLKYIFPEAIAIRKVLMLDERTSCMKPDLLVTLNADGIENSRSGSVNSHLRKMFRSRLLDFAKAHPEGDEIPEDTLPEPFNRSNQDIYLNKIKNSNASSSAETSCDALKEKAQAVASHLSQNFRRRFSQKISGEEDSNRKPSNFLHQLIDVPVEDPCLNKSFSNEELVATVTLSPVKISTSAHLPLSCPLATPVKKADSTYNQDFCSMETPDIQTTPAKLAFSPASLMTVTPSLQPPKKKCLMSPDDDSANSPIKLVRRRSRSRSLKFDTHEQDANSEEDINENGSTS